MMGDFYKENSNPVPVIRSQFGTACRYYASHAADCLQAVISDMHADAM